MANRSCANRRQQVRTVTARQSTAAVFNEPAVRRWPHPVDSTETSVPEEPTLHYIRCALSYQNQLLADIKALLETLTCQETGEK